MHRLLLLCPLLASSCLLFEHANESEGGGASSGTTQGSGAAGAGGGNTGGSGTCELEPAPTLIDCALEDHLDQDPHLCVMGSVSAPPGGTAEPGEVAISHRAAYVLSSASSGCAADEMAIHRFAKGAPPGVNPPPFGCVPLDKLEEGTLTAISLPSKDAVLYSARSGGVITRCDFLDEGNGTCKKLVDIPAPARAVGLETYARGCETELLFAADVPFVSGASFYSVLLDEKPGAIIPRYVFEPGLPATSHAFAVKRRGDRLALGVRGSTDGAVILELVPDGLSPLSSIAIDSSAFIVGARPTSIAVTASDDYARTQGRIFSSSRRLDVPGTGPFAIDDDGLYYVACQGTAPTTACEVGRTATTLDGALERLAPVFAKVGGLATDGESAYFTAVSEDVSEQTNMMLVRYWKNPPFTPNTNH